MDLWTATYFGGEECTGVAPKIRFRVAAIVLAFALSDETDRASFRKEALNPADIHDMSQQLGVSLNFVEND